MSHSQLRQLAAILFADPKRTGEQIIVDYDLRQTALKQRVEAEAQAAQAALSEDARLHGKILCTICKKFYRVNTAGQHFRGNRHCTLARTAHEYCSMMCQYRSGLPRVAEAPTDIDPLKCTAPFISNEKTLSVVCRVCGGLRSITGDLPEKSDVNKKRSRSVDDDDDDAGAADDVVRPPKKRGRPRKIRDPSLIAAPPAVGDLSGEPNATSASLMASDNAAAAPPISSSTADTSTSARQSKTTISRKKRMADDSANDDHDEDDDVDDKPRSSMKEFFEIAKRTRVSEKKSAVDNDDDANSMDGNACEADDELESENF